MSIRKFGIAAAGLTLATSIGAWDPAFAQTTVRVGIYNLPPFGGEPPGGYCVDLVNEMAERVGWQVEFVPMSATDLITRVANGDVDANCSALAATNARRTQGVVFSSPILVNQDTVIVRADNSMVATTIDDLRGLRMGAPVNSAFLQTLQNAGFTDVRTYAGVPEAIAAINAGEIDGFITIAALFQYNHDILGMWPEIKALPSWRPITTNYGTMAVRAGNAELLGVIQNELEEMKADGTLASIIGHWGLPVPPL